jgi:hypothetical protein
VARIIIHSDVVVGILYTVAFAFSLKKGKPWVAEIAIVLNSLILYWHTYKNYSYELGDRSSNPFLCVFSDNKTTNAKNRLEKRL